MFYARITALHFATAESLLLGEALSAGWVECEAAHFALREAEDWTRFARRSGGEQQAVGCAAQPAGRDQFAIAVEHQQRAFRHAVGAGRVAMPHHLVIGQADDVFGL